MSACGKKCFTSTGIHEGITCGRGRLDDYGYWSIPCRPCAVAFDETRKEARKKLFDELIVGGLTEEAAVKFLKENHEWLFMKAWPYS